MGKRNVYCPVCEKNGRKKLLFQTEDDTAGKIIIRCRGCKEDVVLNLSPPKLYVTPTKISPTKVIEEITIHKRIFREPMSRE